MIVDEKINELPSTRNFQEREKKERVKKSGKRMDERMVKKQTTLHKNAV